MKIDAYLQHKSQYPLAALVGPALTWLAEQVAKNSGLSSGYAEGFVQFW
jgi:hypothetical protein